VRRGGSAGSRVPAEELKAVIRLQSGGLNNKSASFELGVLGWINIKIFQKMPSWLDNIETARGLNGIYVCR